MRILTAVFLLTAMAITFASASGHVQIATIAVSDSTFEVAIASDPDSWRKGLQGRQALAADEGMLFAFPEEAELTFWMASVDFPLDIAFFDRCGRLIDSLERLPPCQSLSFFCPKYTSDRPAQFALEINAGEIQSRPLQRGDQLIGLPFPNCQADSPQ